MAEQIFVTKSFLPDFEEYTSLLRGIFERGVLTNQGPLVQKLEQTLQKHLRVDHLQYLTNGTVALQLALRSLGIEGTEVITTPFSYVATVSSLLWEGCTPVFVDVEPSHFTIDPALIEAAITPKTRAILAVHVFGHCCQVEKIQEIADKHKLKVIYDGAHAFGVTHKGKSILSYGDVSTLSFHATKLYHTIEGGACITSNANVNQKIDLSRRFGHIQDIHYSLGINGKQSEFHAAMGLVNLKYISSILKKRKKICSQYTKILQDHVQLIAVQKNCTWNYSYFPVIFKSEKELQCVFNLLQKKNIYPRRYFYPSLNTLPYLKTSTPCPISENIAERIACLPLYPDLTESQVEQIASTIKAALATN